MRNNGIIPDQVLRPDTGGTYTSTEDGSTRNEYAPTTEHEAKTS